MDIKKLLSNNNKDKEKDKKLPLLNNVKQEGKILKLNKDFFALSKQQKDVNLFRQSSNKKNNSNNTVNLYKTYYSKGFGKTKG